MRVSRFWLLTALLLGLSISLPAAVSETPRLTAQPEVVALASAPIFNVAAQLDLALLLSGVAPGDLDAWHARFQPWFDELAARVPPTLSDEKKGELVLDYLHKTHLTRYQTYQTRLDTLIENGTFNCVSSAVAYMLLGRSVGLDVQAVATVSHAFCLVRLKSGKEIDVETTSPYGFNPGTKTEFKDSFGATGFVYVPPGNYSDRKTITDRGLLGLIVQNRMAVWQSQGNLAACVGVAIDRWALDPSADSRQTLVEGFVNLAAEDNSQKNYLAGLGLAESLLGFLGPQPEVKNLVKDLLNNQTQVLLDKNDFSGALALATQWKNRDCLTQDTWNQLSNIIWDYRLVSDVKTLDYLQAAQNVETAFSQGAIAAARRQELLAVVYGQEIQRRAAADGNQAAWQFIDALPEEIRRQPAIAKARDVYAYNWGVDIHNQFAKLWNQGKHDQARQLLTGSLTVQPDNPLLKKDLVLSQGVLKHE